eukprot:2202787-Rhodomonas_salina.1
MKQKLTRVLPLLLPGWRLYPGRIYPDTRVPRYPATAKLPPGYVPSTRRGTRVVLRPPYPGTR